MVVPYTVMFGIGVKHDKQRPNKRNESEIYPLETFKWTHQLFERTVRFFFYHFCYAKRSQDRLQNLESQPNRLEWPTSGYIVRVWDLWPWFARYVLLTIFLDSTLWCLHTPLKGILLLRPQNRTLQLEFTHEINK